MLRGVVKGRRVDETKCAVDDVKVFKVSHSTVEKDTLGTTGDASGGAVRSQNLITSHVSSPKSPLLCDDDALACETTVPTHSAVLSITDDQIEAEIGASDLWGPLETTTAEKDTPGSTGDASGGAVRSHNLNSSPVSSQKSPLLHDDHAKCADDETTIPTHSAVLSVSDDQIEAKIGASDLWGPLETDQDAKLCQVRVHRIVKPDNDPLLDAALQLL